MWCGTEFAEKIEMERKDWTDEVEERRKKMNGDEWKEERKKNWIEKDKDKQNVFAYFS